MPASILPRQSWGRVRVPPKSVAAEVVAKFQTAYTLARGSMIVPSTSTARYAISGPNLVWPSDTVTAGSDASPPLRNARGACLILRLLQVGFENPDRLVGDAHGPMPEQPLARHRPDRQRRAEMDHVQTVAHNRDIISDCDHILCA